MFTNRSHQSSPVEALSAIGGYDRRGCAVQPSPVLARLKYCLGSAKISRERFKVGEI